MPYQIFEHDGQFCLRNQQTGKMVAGSCHKVKQDTMAMMRALYANEGKAMQDENGSLIYFGGEVKALGEGKVGGYLVRFSTSADPDLTNDFFTPETDFFLDEEPKAWVLYDHGRDATLKNRKLGRGKVKIDDVGLWIEAQLQLRDEYEKAVYELAKKGKLGWSSGSLNHLVEREPQGKAFRIMAWPIGEASLTPNPAEFRNAAFSLKSFIAEREVELEQKRAADLSANVLEELADTEDEVKAQWTTAYMNDLPDSSFAYIEPGGEKDGDGKTKPRSMRHFPYKDANGKLDEAHVRNALARIPQSGVSAEAKAKALAIIKRAAKSLGIDVADGGGKSYTELFEGLPALKEVVSPIDLKGGLDERSEAVEAAVDEVLRYNRLANDSIKAHVGRIEDNARFRFEKDGRSLSQTKRAWVEAARDRIARLIESHRELDESLARIQKMFQMTDVQRDAANEAARHELLRTYKLAGITAEER